VTTRAAALALSEKPRKDRFVIRVGSTVGNYTIISKLGEGAMATVFLAEHPRIGRRVAIKVIHPELSTSQEMVSRFFTEARAASQIHHENVVDIQDFGQTPDGDNFIIMEYLEGDTLAVRMKAQEGPLDVARAIRIANLITEGLAAAHAQGVIHRDLKPDNIYLVRRGAEADFPKILDFGLAKLTGGPGQINANHKTRTGSVLGTPHFMAPEQCEGKSTIDARADIYSLGCILYQMLTGDLPFPGEGFGEVLVKHLREPVPSARRHNPQVSEALDKVVMHCLAKRREYRFQSMLDVGRALRDPERFSAEIGNDPRRIVGPAPGESDPGPGQGPDPAPAAKPGPAPEIEVPPPTLIGQSVIPLPPPPMGLPPQGSPPPQIAAPEQRTMIAMPSPLAPQGPGQMPPMPQGALANMETVLTGTVPPLPPPPQAPVVSQAPPGVRSGQTVMADYNPASPHDMPTIAPGTKLPFPIPPGPGPGFGPGSGPNTRPFGGTGALPPVNARPFYKNPAVIGGVVGMVLVVLGLLIVPLLRPRTFTLQIQSAPPGADVLLDGKPAGKTPFTLQMKRGDKDVQLTLRKDGFFDVMRQVSATSGNLDIKLRERPKQEEEDDRKPEKAPEVVEKAPEKAPDKAVDKAPEKVIDKNPEKKPGGGNRPRPPRPRVPDPVVSPF
jgi:serine/threonine protein kinase